MENCPPVISLSTENDFDSTEAVVDGKRMTVTRDLIKRVIELCTSVARTKDFALNLKPVYKKDPENFKKIHSQLIEQFKSHINEEMECMYKEENLQHLLNKLDKLCKDSDPGIEAWRPSGEPEIDVQAHLVSAKIKQRDQLQEILKTLESKNRLLQSALKPKQKKILETCDKIEEHHHKIKQISDVLCDYRMETMHEYIQKHP